MASKKNNFKKNNNGRTVGTIIGSILILLIVVISFVVAPSLTQLGSNTMSDIELGSYGKEKITFSFLNETPFRRELASLSSSSTDTMDFRLAQVAYKRAVTKAAAIDEFTTNGYLVSKEQLDDAVLQSGYFNVNGSFSSKVFKNTTESKKQELRNDVERELKVNSWMYHTLIQQKRSKAYLEFISSMSNVKRNFEYVTYNYSEYPENLVNGYAAKDTELFRELSLSRITVDKMSVADTILEKIKSGEATFEDLAPKYSTDNFKNNGGKLNTATYVYDLEKLFGITNRDSVLNMTTADLPLVVEKDNLIILIKLNKDIDKTAKIDTNVVRNYMLSYDRGIIEDYFYNLINSIDNNSLLSLGKDIKETGEFSINFGSEQLLSTSIDRSSSDSIFTKAVNNDNFFTVLFNLPENSLSEPIVLGDTISVFKLKKEISSETMNDSYILASLDRALVNYKSVVSENLIMKSDKYKDNFFQGYLEILKINQGL